MHCQNKILRLFLIFGILLKVQITVSQNFGFGRAGLGDASFGEQFRGGAFGRGAGQFGGRGQRFQGRRPNGLAGLNGFNGAIDGGTTVIGEGGAFGTRFGGNLGGGAARGLQGFGFGGTGQTGNEFELAGGLNGGLLGGRRLGGVNGLALGPRGQEVSRFDNFGQEFGGRFGGTLGGGGGGLSTNAMLREQRRRLAANRIGAGAGRSALGTQGMNLLGGVSQDTTPLFLDPITGQNVRVFSSSEANAIRTMANGPTVAREGRAGTNLRSVVGRTTADANRVILPGSTTARRVSPAISTRQRAIAAARARAVPSTLNNLFANAENMTEVNRALGLPVPIRRTTTTTPRPLESVNWLGFTRPLQRRRQTAAQQSFSTRNNNDIRNNNRLIQQQRQTPNRNAVDRRRTFGRNSMQISQREQNSQRIPSRNFAQRQSSNRIQPIRRLEDFNSGGRIPVAPQARVVTVTEDDSLVREFRRRLERQNRERFENALQRASNAERISAARNSLLDRRQENNADFINANRQIRRRPSSNQFRDLELQSRRQTIASDNILSFNSQQPQELPSSFNDQGFTRTASPTLERRLPIQQPPRDFGQQSRSTLRSGTGADGTREIVVDVISDTAAGSTDWSTVNDPNINRDPRLRGQTFADNSITFESIRNDPQGNGFLPRQVSSDFSGSTSLDFPPSEFNFQQGFSDNNLPSRAAPLELAELSNGLDWATLDNFIRQRQDQQLRVGQRATAAAAASASAANRMSMTSRARQTAPIPGAPLTLASVDTRQFTIPSVGGSNPLNTADSGGRRPIFAIVPLNSQASMVDIQNFVKELATSINKAGPSSPTNTNVDQAVQDKPLATDPAPPPPL